MAWSRDLKCPTGDDARARKSECEQFYNDWGEGVEIRSDIKSVSMKE